MKRLGVLVGTVVLAATGYAAISGELPKWRPGGADPVLHEPLDAVSARIGLRAGERVVFEGDSNTAGTRVGGGRNAFPERLRQLCDCTITVENRAVGGATVDTWAVASAKGAGLVVIMRGTNDAAPRGLLSSRSAVPITRFRKALVDAIAKYRRDGAQVLVLAASPAGSPAMDRRIAPYRLAARRAAEDAGAAFMDPVTAFAAPGGQKLLQYDALHLTRHGQDVLAAWLARELGFSV